MRAGGGSGGGSGGGDSGVAIGCNSSWLLLLVVDARSVLRTGLEETPLTGEESRFGSPDSTSPPAMGLAEASAEVAAGVAAGGAAGVVLGAEASDAS